MLFNSIDFALFLPLVFLLYWYVVNKNLKLQNFLIVAASYVFYGWWDWRFLSLIVFSTLVDYTVGLKLSSEQRAGKRKVLLWISILVNLGFLGFFKYYNFFLDNFVTAFSFLGKDIGASSLSIILPVGISFYTFQTLSYTIDVYRRKLEPTKDIVAFSAFVSFFPQLVAGPIERATNLLPQFYKERKFDYRNGVDGMRQIMWGLFKKIVIADSCAEFTSYIFSDYSDLSGSTLVIGAILFSFQIYGDFSGYSDIAIGTSRLFGFNLKQNFAFPYFSRDIAEFWRRWHVSLSTWFRDYLYIPLGGSKTTKWKVVRNIFIVYLVSGFWHGAEWTYVVWGGLNAVYFLPMLLLKRNRKNIDIVASDRLLPSFNDLVKIILTFGLFTFSLIIFRSENMSHALGYVGKMFSVTLFELPVLEAPDKFFSLAIYILILLVVEWSGRHQEYGFANTGAQWPSWLRYSMYNVVCAIILYFAMGNNEVQFIYFQF